MGGIFGKLLGSAVGGGYLYAAIALASIGVGGYAMHVWDASTIADLRIEIEADKTAIADYSAAVATDAAQANEKARRQEHDLAASAAELRSRLGTDEALLSSRSDELEKGLRDAPQEDIMPLGRAVLQYLDGVRRDQGAVAP